MLLILGNYPSRENEQDGMVQRIAKIDEILAERDRTYVCNVIQLSKIKSLIKWFYYFLLNFSKPFNTHKNAKVYPFLRYRKFLNLVKTADKIYVHSLNFMNLIPLHFIKEFGGKIVLDIHGCVVEELIFYKASEDVIKKFKILEKTTFESVETCISVSQNMTEFYQDKYKNKKMNFIQIPIFDMDISHNVQKDTKSKINVIYAGGNQKWQNVDIMCDLIKKTSKFYDYNILTPNCDFFIKKINDEKVLSNIKILSVEKKDVSQYYENADFGLVLRDNDVVNHVSCPTKLMEYIQHGIIPIVMQPHIGDFNRLNYKYILLEDFLKQQIPTQDEMEQIRIHNFHIFETLMHQTKTNIVKLLSFIEEKNFN